MEKIQENPWVFFFVVIFVSACIIAWTRWIFSKLGSQRPTEPPPVEWALGAIINAPIVEEFWYRLVPMIIFYYGLPHPWWVGYWFVGGPVFGAIHGTKKAFSHSVGGLMFCASFYGIEHNYGIVVAYVINVLIHFMVNFFFNIDQPHPDD